MSTRESTIPWPRKPWWRGNPPSGQSFGYLLPTSLVTALYRVPTARDIRALGRNKVPYFWVINYNAMASQDTADDQIAPTSNFVLLSMQYTSSQAAGIRSQLFQVADDSGNGFRFSRVGVDGDNMFGTARHPLYLRRPYPMPNNYSLLNRTLSKATAENNVQLVLYGVKDFDNSAGM